jgi:uncharacterized protein YtpQ (UPF0354 family)
MARVLRGLMNLCGLRRGEVARAEQRGAAGVSARRYRRRLAVLAVRPTRVGHLRRGSSEAAPTQQLLARRDPSMAHMPREPEAFAEQVATLLKRLQPDYMVELTGPRELVVNGRRLDLENLFRLVSHDPERGTEIVEHYLDQLFSGEAATIGSVAFELIRERIMPRIQPETIFNHLCREQVAHVPFVNGTVIVFVIDMPQMTVSVTTEQMVRWGVSAEQLEELARDNLQAHSQELQIQVVTSKEGGKAVILAEQDGYDAARLLLGSLHSQLAPRLGPNFLVATPARDMFVAMTPGPNPFVQRLANRVREDFNRLPYPITPAFFYVTRDGVAGTEPLENAA